ncbi:MAG: hypothetical protein FK730_09425 [Asgard group archaeon]|nr:hypothetical protein [Asgard group archaeon]
MNVEDFRKYGKENGLSDEIISRVIDNKKEFNEFLKESKRNANSAITEDVHRYAQHLIKIGKNNRETFFALIRYSNFSKNDEMLIALWELLDGSNVPDNLSKTLDEMVKPEIVKKILEGIDFPPLGTTADKKPIITKKVVERLVENLDEKTCHKVLVNNLHGIPKESIKKQREAFLKAKNVDEYLNERRENFIKSLEKIRDEKRLFFTQELDDKVIEHVKNNPQIEGGVRKGNIVYAEKIPYMTKKFLNETDENMKKYYYCHCSWVREALKTGDVKVPSKFCDCSAGYYKNQWDVILDQPVDVDTVETIIDGHSRCLFAIHLPDEVVKKAEEK